MKIAILHSGDLEKVSLGGVDRYIKSLISFFDDNEITIFGTTHSDEHVIGKKYQKNYCGKKYYFIPISNDEKHPLSIWYVLNEYKWLKRLAQYDCIYSQRTEYSVPFMFSPDKKKLIEIIHGSSKYSKVFFSKKMAIIQLLMEKMAVAIAKKTLIILNREEFGVPYYKKKYSKYSDRFIYGRNPIDTSIYKSIEPLKARNKLHLDETRKIILFSGRIENTPKRVLLLPDICQKVKSKYNDILFIVIGDGKDRDELIDNILKMV